MIKEKFKCIKTYLIYYRYNNIEIPSNSNLEFEFDGICYKSYYDNIQIPFELRILPDEFNIYFKSLKSIREDKLDYILNSI